MTTSIASKAMVRAAVSDTVKRPKGQDAFINFVNPRLKQFKMAFILACVIGLLTTFTTAMIAYALYNSSCKTVQLSTALPFLTSLSEKASCTPKSFRYWIIGDTCSDSSGTFGINSWKFGFTNQPASFQVLQNATNNLLRQLTTMDHKELQYTIVNGYTLTTDVTIPGTTTNMTFKMTFSRTKTATPFDPRTDILANVDVYDASYIPGSKRVVSGFTMPTDVIKAIASTTGSVDSSLVGTLVSASSTSGSAAIDSAAFLEQASALYGLDISSMGSDIEEFLASGGNFFPPSLLFQIASVGGDPNSTFSYSDFYSAFGNFSGAYGYGYGNSSYSGMYGGYGLGYGGDYTNSSYSSYIGTPPLGGVRRRLADSNTANVTSGGELMPDEVWDYNKTFVSLKNIEWQVTIESVGFESKVASSAKVQKDLLDKLLKRAGKNITKTGPQVNASLNTADQLLQGTFMPGADMDPQYATKEWCTFRMPAQRWLHFFNSNGSLVPDDVGDNGMQLHTPQCCIFLPTGENWCAILQEQDSNLDKQLNGTKVWATVMRKAGSKLPWEQNAAAQGKQMTRFMLNYLDRSLLYWKTKMEASRFGPEFRLSMNGVSLDCEDIVCQTIPAVIGQALGWSVYAELAASIVVLGVYFVIMARKEHMTVKQIMQVLVATVKGEEEEKEDNKNKVVPFREDVEKGASESEQKGRG